MDRVPILQMPTYKEQIIRCHTLIDYLQIQCLLPTPLPQSPPPLPPLLPPPPLPPNHPNAWSYPGALPTVIKHPARW